MLASEKPDLVLCAKDMSESLDGYGQMAKDCLQAGAWAFVERPVTLNPAEARELIALEKKTGCYIIPRYQRRYVTAYLLAQNIARSAEFGKPLLFSIKGDTSPYATELDFIDKHLSHFIDLAAMYFDGLTITHVSSLTAGPHKYGYQISLRDRAGAIGLIQSVAFQSQSYPVERLEILSDGRAVIVENADSVHYMRPSAADGSLSPAIGEGSEIKTFAPNRGGMTTASNARYAELFAHILDCIERGVKPGYSIADSMSAILLLEEFKQKAGVL
jgi:predicted dehydrogenase